MKRNLSDTVAPMGRPSTLSRRRLLHAGCAGAVILMTSAGSIAGPAKATLQNLDFGPDYTVLNVTKKSSRTEVKLAFYVNGRRFTMVLWSTDGVVWRPV